MVSKDAVEDDSARDTLLTGAARKAKLAGLPNAPGVYVFHGAGGQVLYVGKARSLRSRVRSYFATSTSDDRYFIHRLDRELVDIETVLLSSEKEAALLENQLIKELQPRYNFKLRDDKEFLSLRLNDKAEWPRLEVVRRPRKDGVRYYGPYASATAARQTLRLVNRFFQLRTCTDAELARRTRPCLQYQIKRCPGPCVEEVDRTEYNEQVRLVGLFLDGRHDELSAELEERMSTSSEALAYEQAARYRDQLQAVRHSRQPQRVTDVRNVDQDVIALYRQADQAQVAVLLVRAGRLTSVRPFDLKDLSIPNDEVLASFLREYYVDGTFLPEEIILPDKIEAMDGLAEVLSERKGKRLRILVPTRGPREKMVTMARENAKHAFEQRARATEDVEARLAQVQKRLKLTVLPRRIECIDISHSAGEDTVAAIVALKDGSPDRDRYRSFTIRRARASDDYGAMFEALERRFTRGKAGEAGWSLPDLLVVDGGKGQLGVALAVLKELGLRSVPAVGLAKEKANPMEEALTDRVYLPRAKNAISLRSNAALQMLALARDEAHRFSNLQRTRKEKRRQLRSDLDAVPGVGPKTRQKLLRELGSLKAVMEASEGDLVDAGATKKQAEAIRRTLGRLPVDRPKDDPHPEHETRSAEEAAVENAFSQTPASAD